MKNKKGFISMTLVYTFLILFLFLMASILSVYTKKSDYLERIDSKIKDEVILDNTSLNGEIDTSIKGVILASNTVYADNVTSTYVTSATGIDFAAKSSLTNGQGLYTNTKLEDGSNTYFRGGSFCAYTNYEIETSSGTYCTAAGGNWSGTYYTCDLNSSRATCQSKGFTYYDLKNNITFAGHNWRIIRIDENDNVRLILSDNSVSTSVYNSGNSDNAYLGYMYGTVPSTTYAIAHTNTNNSTLKVALDNYYSLNLASYSSYIADAGYCNDREINSGLGYGTADTSYKNYARNSSNATASPRLNMSASCTNSARDLFTTASSTIGNKKLTYPIGLITADETRYAGLLDYDAAAATRNYTSYLLMPRNYYTMSVEYYWTSNTYIYKVYMAGYTNGSTCTESLGLYFSIALKPTVVVSSGTGTYDNPYVVN